MAVPPESFAIRSWNLSRSIFSGADRKSTHLNSSHLVISYAVFCLKKKNNHDRRTGPGTDGEINHILYRVPEKRDAHDRRPRVLTTDPKRPRPYDLQLDRQTEESRP